VAPTCNCAVQCQTLLYKTEITQSTLSDAALRYLVDKHKLNKTLDEMRRNYVVLEVSYCCLLFVGEISINAVKDQGY
jgi:hypothetical protein